MYQVLYNETTGQYRLYGYDKLTRKWKRFSSSYYNKDLAVELARSRVKYEA